MHLFQSALVHLDTYAESNRHDKTNLKRKVPKIRISKNERHVPLGRQLLLQQRNPKRSENLNISKMSKESPLYPSSKKADSSIEKVIESRRDQAARLTLPAEIGYIQNPGVPEQRLNNQQDIDANLITKKKTKESIPFRNTKKSEMKMGQAWIEKQIQLSHRISIFERERHHLFGLLLQKGDTKRNVSKPRAAHIASFTSLCEELEKYAALLDDERGLDAGMITRKVAQVKRSIQKIHRTVQAMKEGHDGEYPSTLSDLMEETEDKIKAAHATMRSVGEHLAREEEALNNEVDFF